MAPGKFVDPKVTADGSRRAVVTAGAMDTLWFNTGTLCNLACASCYIESSPTNDALQYLAATDVSRFLDEIGASQDARISGLGEIGFTGGEPFMNPDFLKMLGDTLDRGFRALVLTNAMKPMQRDREALLALRQRHGGRLVLRVSIDHYSCPVHEGERGRNSWTPMLEGLKWLSDAGFSIAVAGRHLASEHMDAAREGYATLFRREGIAIDAFDMQKLVLFPEMDESADVAEITEACWGILGKSPADVMCASSRMVIHRKGEATPRVAACTLLPFDPRFDLGATLTEALQPVPLNHPHCARFCVLGGASCSA